MDTSPPGRGLTTVPACVLAALLTAGITALLYARVAAEDPPDSPPSRTVNTVAYHSQPVYRRQVSYLGLIAAGRKATLGFEVPGQIATMPLREGSPVRAGELIASLDDAALLARRRATAAEREQIRTELELAQIKSRRQRELSASGAVSKEAYDETRLRAQALASGLEAVTARLAGIDIELEKSRLVAPYDGIIGERYVYQGAVVSPGAPVVRLVETRAREAHVGVPAPRAGTLEVGESYTLRIRDTQFTGTLQAVRPDVEPLTRTTTAVFLLPPELEALDGEPVTLEVEESIAMAGGWLPLSALLEGQRGAWTVLRLQATDDNHYVTVREAVEVLDLRGDQAYVRGTLPDGALVVADGVHRITPGIRVAVGEAP